MGHCDTLADYGKEEKKKKKKKKENKERKLSVNRFVPWFQPELTD